MKNKKTAGLIGSLFLLLCIFVGCGEHAGEKEYNKALAAMKKDDLVRARSLFDKSIRKSSSAEQKSVALNQLGLVLWKLGEKQAATEAFSKSCSQTDSLTGANLNLGIALFHSGRFEEAELALNNVLGNDPENTTAQTMLGLLEMKKKNWAAATRKIAQSAQAMPGDPALQTAGALAKLHIDRNSATAVSQLKKTFDAHPDYAPAAYNLAVIYDKWLGNKSAAISWYKQYLQITDADAPRARTAAKAVAQLGGQAARTHDTETNVNNPDAAARFIAAGSVQYAAKNYADAIVEYRKAVQADPQQKSAHYNMGLAYYAMGNYDDATRACLKALQLDSRFTDARYMLALAYVQQRNWNDAEKEASALRQLDPARAKVVSKYINDSR